MRRTRSELTTLLRTIDEGYEKKAWHGPNLRGSLRGVSAKTAAQRPGPGRHTIWEIAIHTAYWKYTVWRKLTRTRRGSFPLRGSNWIRRPTDPSEAAWRSDVRFLHDIHGKMREAISALVPEVLHSKAPQSKYTYHELILGIALHDVYHAGQIQLLKRLAR